MRLYTTLVVNTPATSYDLTDLTTVKEELNINTTDNDDLLSRWITQASKRIQKYCDRVFQVEQITETFRTNADLGMAPYRTFGVAQSLELRRRPIVSIESIVEDTRTLTVDVDYTYDIETGIVYRLYDLGRAHWWSICSRKVVVAYHGGFAVIPEDLAQACLLYVRKKWAERGRDPTLRQVTIEGVGSKTYWVSNATVTGSRNDAADLTPEIEAMLIDYRGYSFA